MVKSFIIFVVGLWGFLYILTGYGSFPNNGSDLFIGSVAGMFCVMGLLGIFSNHKHSK
jgi:hypothetical protein